MSKRQSTRLEIISLLYKMLQFQYFLITHTHTHSLSLYIYILYIYFILPIYLNRLISIYYLWATQNLCRCFLVCTHSSNISKKKWSIPCRLEKPRGRTNRFLSLTCFRSARLIPEASNDSQMLRMLVIFALSRICMRYLFTAGFLICFYFAITRIQWGKDAFNETEEKQLHL